MGLRIRHRARLKPAVEYLVDALEHPLALGRWDREVIDVLPMQVGDRRDAGALLELLDARDDHHLLAVVAHPHRDGSSPEAVARDRPVARRLEPVVKALLLHERRHPVRLRVVREQPLTERLDVDKRARHGAVDERRVRPPAERVRVIDLADGDHAPLPLEELDDLLVGVLHKLAGELGHLGREAAVGVERADERLSLLDDAVRQADLVILLAKGGGAVYDARTSVVGDKVTCDDFEGALGAHALDEVVKGRRVLCAKQLLAREAPHLLELLLRVLLLLRVAEVWIELHEARAEEDVRHPRLDLQHLDVLHRRVNAEREVGWQRPRRRRPRDELRVRFRHEWEGAHDGRIVDRLVVLLHLEV
mmetsp:Transcript_53427/g.138155  ORF Transcript_53427/g.138155 Transcript_53427/m.138155 type:complete len:362 (+) Transcript_53427:2201-3286(+)